MITLSKDTFNLGMEWKSKVVDATEFVSASQPLRYIHTLNVRRGFLGTIIANEIDSITDVSSSDEVNSYIISGGTLRSNLMVFELAGTGMLKNTIYSYFGKPVIF